MACCRCLHPGQRHLEAPHTSYTEQFIVKALRNSRALTISLVAEEDGVIVGHVAVSPISISDGTPDWFGLGPFSVIPECQNRGVGSKLMHEAISALKNTGAAGCVLLGDPIYYSRFGFKPKPNLILPDVPPEYFQALSFRSHLPQGIVAYHDAFNAQG